MFKIQGIKGEKQYTAVWDNGVIDHPELAQVVSDAISERLARSEFFIVWPSMQESVVAFSDPYFCYEVLAHWFDIIVKVEGETGLISEPGVVY